MVQQRLWPIWLLRSGYFWPMIFKDTFEQFCTCHICHTSANRDRHPTMPLQPLLEVHPFAKWGLDFIILVNPPSSTRHTFVLTTTDYYTWWVEEKKFRNYTTKIVTDFLEEHIVTRFGMPFFLVCDNGSTFASIFLT